MIAVSEQFCLRRLSVSDLTAFQAYRGDPDVARYQSWQPMDAEEATLFLAQMARVDPLLRPGHWTQIAIAHRTTDRLMGDMGLYLSENGEDAEVGITLSSGDQRQGHATRAMRLAFDLLWNTTSATTIRAWADQRNVASVALLNAAGMTHLGTETNDVVEEAFALIRPDGC